jgi:lipopolysaccharide export system protein LptA
VAGPTPNINVGNANGMAGQTVAVAVTLVGGGSQLTATSNDIVYDSTQVRVALSGSTPVCTINPAIAGGTAADKMLLLSRSAVGANMERLRVGVISFQNSNPIPDGLLFSCSFVIDAAATAGAKVLANTPSASNMLGDPAAVGGANGSINVQAAGLPAIDVGNASGAPGANVGVTVTLSGGANGLTATSNDIVYDSTQVRVALSGSTPVCTINPAIAGGTAADKMLLLSRASAGANMERLRVGVISFQNSNPIPDGPLFTCTFVIDPSASAGSKALANTPSASDMLGDPANVVGANGSITVEANSGPSIDVGTASGSAGATVSISATLSGGANALTATSNDIVYDTTQVRVVLSGSTPVCTINAAIAGGTAADKMLLLSRSAVGANMERLRVGVISFQNSNPIPDGQLFSCSFQVDAAATPGAKVLANTPSGSDALGDPVEVGGDDGSITVQ